MATMKWGQWIQQRALLCGIATKREMATRCNVTPKVVAAWYAADLPLRLRDTSVEAIATALVTHPEVVKHDYQRFDPSLAPTRDDFHSEEIEKFAGTELLRLAKEAGYVELVALMTEHALVSQIQNALEVLSGTELVQVAKLCRSLRDMAFARMDDRTAEAGELYNEVLRIDSLRWNKILKEQKEKLISAVEKRIRPK